MLKKTMFVAVVVAAGLFAQDGAFAMGGHYRRHRAGFLHADARHTFRRDAVSDRGLRRFAFRRRGHSRRMALGLRFPSATALLRTTVAATGSVQEGRASFYSGRRTANGGLVGASTCAHRSLPFGTRVLVTNLANARQTILTVNDRGPFIGGRILDVSRGAAGVLGMLHAGVSQIRMQVLGGSG